MIRARQKILLLYIVMAMPLLVEADMKIYKWTDSHGVVHYSEHAPASGSVELSLQTRQTLSLIPASLPDYRATLELARALEASRLEREKHRLEKHRQIVEREKAMQRRDRYLAPRSATVLYTPYRFYRKRLHKRFPGERAFHGGKPRRMPADTPAFVSVQPPVR